MQTTETDHSLCASAADMHLATLHNGLRVLAIRMPGRQTVNLSVFIRTGSQHESRRSNGISHVVEHMAFKGTHERSCQRINLDAERLGAELNAHTDKDHTAFHIEGLLRDLPSFVTMLADIVQHSTFPQAELDRERQVILHEFTEFDEDPATMAFKLFDSACYGEHAVARPVIGSRANVARFTRDELLGHVASHYRAGNVVVAVAGDVDAERFGADVESAFANMPGGETPALQEPAWQGGVKTRRLAGCSQTQVVFGFAAPSLRGDAHPAVLAAALFGEGMSSPLLDEIRERRGLAYYAACSADIAPLCGQFVIEAATAPGHLDEFFAQVMRLLRAQADGPDKVALERARKQLTVRTLRALEQPVRRLESAVQDIFTFGHPRAAAQWLERLHAVGAAEVRDTFARMLASPAAVALAGSVPQRAAQRVQAHLLPLA